MIYICDCCVIVDGGCICMIMSNTMQSVMILDTTTKQSTSRYYHYIRFIPRYYLQYVNILFRFMNQFHINPIIDALFDHSYLLRYHSDDDDHSSAQIAIDTGIIAIDPLSKRVLIRSRIDQYHYHELTLPISWLSSSYQQTIHDEFQRYQLECSYTAFAALYDYKPSNQQDLEDLSHTLSFFLSNDQLTATYDPSSCILADEIDDKLFIVTNLISETNLETSLWIKSMKSPQFFNNEVFICKHTKFVFYDRLPSSSEPLSSDRLSKTIPACLVEGLMGGLAYSSADARTVMDIVREHRHQLAQQLIFHHHLEIHHIDNYQNMRLPTTVLRYYTSKDVMITSNDHPKPIMITYFYSYPSNGKFTTQTATKDPSKHIYRLRAKFTEDQMSLDIDLDKQVIASPTFSSTVNSKLMHPYFRVGSRRGQSRHTKQLFLEKCSIIYDITR
jgi:hypothetical protein